MPTQPGIPQDPYRAYNFKFEFQGTVQAHFVKVEGLGLKLERILYRAGGEHSQAVSYTHLDVYKRQPSG